MRRRLFLGLRTAVTWHRLMLQGSPGYRRLCYALASFLTTGYWDFRPQQDHPDY